MLLVLVGNFRLAGSPVLILQTTDWAVSEVAPASAGGPKSSELDVKASMLEIVPPTATSPIVTYISCSSCAISVTRRSTSWIACPANATLSPRRGYSFEEAG
jgi:hypothetical protein